MTDNDFEDRHGWALILVASLLSLAVFLRAVDIAQAHEQWANGGPIPDWVKSSCCGPADAHHLTPEQVHDMGDYYQIDGMTQPIQKFFGPQHFPNSAILPSQDGDYWVFYKDEKAHRACGHESNTCWDEPASEQTYCFFVPVAL